MGVPMDFRIESERRAGNPTLKGLESSMGSPDSMGKASF
jgi:hypothetical protein